MEQKETVGAFGCMLRVEGADPLAGRIDYDELERMTDELLAATSEWLPQFA